MAQASLPIPPFPADTDREAFGHWLSGFTDGEGHFSLCMSGHKNRHGTRNPHARFQIALRADDLPILRLIQSFFGCGHVERSQQTAANAQFRFRVDRIDELASAIVPHFLRYPLRAKKARDFIVWCEGVDIIRQTLSVPRPNTRWGYPSRWTASLLGRFTGLVQAIKATRRFDPDAFA
jgi:hypothetical protein